MTKTGRCLCGAVTYSYEGPENWRAHCHCESWRRATASPMTSFMGVPYSAFRYTSALPAKYGSSPGVTRSFCPTCGTPMAYENERDPEEIHLYAATLDRPEDFEPEFQVHADEQLPWLQLADGPPKKVFDD